MTRLPRSQQPPACGRYPYHLNGALCKILSASGILIMTRPTPIQHDGPPQSSPRTGKMAEPKAIICGAALPGDPASSMAAARDTAKEAHDA